MLPVLRLARWVDALAAVAGRAAAWCCLPIMALIVLDVVARRFFAVGSVMLQELEWHFHALLFLFALAWAYQADAHVRIDLVAQRLGARTRAGIEVAGGLLFLLPFTGMVAWFGAGFVARAWGVGEVSADPGGLPYRWLIKAALPLAFGLVFLQGLSMIVRRLAALAGRAPERA